MVPHIETSVFPSHRNPGSTPSAWSVPAPSSIFFLFSFQEVHKYVLRTVYQCHPDMRFQLTLMLMCVNYNEDPFAKFLLVPTRPLIFIFPQ
jgi:hypothetical protein